MDHRSLVRVFFGEETHNLFVSNNAQVDDILNALEAVAPVRHVSNGRPLLILRGNPLAEGREVLSLIDGEVLTVSYLAEPATRDQHNEFKDPVWPLDVQVTHDTAEMIEESNLEDIVVGKDDRDDDLTAAATLYAMQFQPAHDVPHMFYGDRALIPVDAEAEAPRRSARIREQQTRASLSQDGAVQALQGTSTYLILDPPHPNYLRRARSKRPFFSMNNGNKHGTLLDEISKDAVQAAKDDRKKIISETPASPGVKTCASTTKKSSEVQEPELGSRNDVSNLVIPQHDHEKSLEDLHHEVPEIQGAGDSVTAEEARPHVEPENHPENAAKPGEEKTSVEKGIDR